MSEYQYLAFQAVDRPLTDADMAYARRQSTRAEITRWTFRNEYHFGDFHGDAIGLLRHGYDVHLHYANFGVRTAALRLPDGLPFPVGLVEASLESKAIQWEQDENSAAGVLVVSPYWEVDTLDELWEFEQYLAAMAHARKGLITGDARVLYLLWLVASFDDESDPDDLEEAPVPAGLGEVVEQHASLLEFFGTDLFLPRAAAEGAGLLSGEQRFEQWPCTTPDREGSALIDRAEEIRSEQQQRKQRQEQLANERKQAEQAASRSERIAQIARNPEQWLRRVDLLVENRGTKNYEEAAETLSEFSEALGDAGRRLSREHATHLVQKHPTLHRLKFALRERGLWG